ncbi:MAG: DUF1232 domain-containing protein [Bacteroidaceae bacterium]|nr:DUF1232 domain-containing protein [Bacteroidaceae bacterium]
MKLKKNYNPIATGRQVYQNFVRGRWFSEAKEYLADKDKMHDLLGMVAYLFRNRSLAPVFKDLLLLYYYVKDIASGKYQNYSKAKILMVVALLIYIVTPFDLVPDWIPGAGFLDDIALLGYVVKMADKELERYYRWSKQQPKTAKKETSTVPNS